MADISPRPWKRALPDSTLIEDQAGNEVAGVFRKGHEQANSQLIAAAPELADAASRAVEAWKRERWQVFPAVPTTTAHTDTAVFMGELQEALRKAGWL